MALDFTVQKQISTFIQSQFPRLYEEYGQAFIDFVEAYYVWMETQGPLFDSRRARDYQDIDTTVDRFIIFFKDKYLQNIQLETRSNVDLLVKHSLDVYRSRGTIRSIDLLFRLVFGTGAQVYYPFDDVFQPSSGEWIIPKYLEVSSRDDLDKFVGKEIIGITSGAQAFVESWIRKKAGSKQIDCLYISALEGNFATGERINTINSPFNLLDCPTMVGSLTSVIMNGGGLGFNIGDVLPIIGTNGYGAKARVSNVADATGIVSFTLNDGGYGYTANALVLVSQSVLSMINVTTGNTSVDGNYFKVFETITQPSANINYQSAVGGHFANNDSIIAYFANGNIAGTGICLASANGSSTNGQIQVSILSGNLQSNAIYNAGNAVSANVPVSGGYIDTTASGNVIAEALSFTSNVNNITGGFILNEHVHAGANTSGVLTRYVQTGAVGSLTVSNRTGIWAPNTTITGITSGATANLTVINMNVGIINLHNSFIGDSRALVVAPSSNTQGYIPLLNQGSGATFQISPTLLYPETIIFNTDPLAPAMSTRLNNVYTTFTAFPSANLATPLALAFGTISDTIGKIAALIGTSPGSNYTAPPLARILEPVSFAERKRDTKILEITGATGSFVPGELITQASTLARGLVISSNSSILVFNKLTLINAFGITSNSSGIIIGTSSGSTANVNVIDDYLYSDPENIGETFLGFNADISATTQAANGSITQVDIAASGWGFEDGESLIITSSNGSFNATGIAQLGRQGHSPGFYRTENGFVSGTKKIQDNDYYQVSAYEVRASVAFDRYKDMLKALLHVAGTRAFGAFVYKTTGNAHINILSAKITQA